MYGIRVTRYFFNTPDRTDWLRNFATDERREFKTKAQAEDFVKACEGEVYYLSHNEYARPDYKVSRIRNPSGPERFRREGGSLFERQGDAFIHVYRNDRFAQVPITQLIARYHASLSDDDDLS